MNLHNTRHGEITAEALYQLIKEMEAAHGSNWEAVIQHLKDAIKLLQFQAIGDTQNRQKAELAISTLRAFKTAIYLLKENDGSGATGNRIPPLSA